MPSHIFDIRPRFRGKVIFDKEVVFVDPEGRRSVPADVEGQTLASLVARMDGSQSVAELASKLDPALQSDLGAIVATMDAFDLVDDAAIPDVISGLEFLLELEELTDQLSAASIHVNPFWRACLNAQAPGDLPLSVVQGMVIENWHFLVRESYFDAPVLSFVPNRAVRLAMNAFFAEEYGHDDLLLRALETIGLTSADLHDSIPLPETLGLCNALAYWSLHDPLFFFTTLGLLEGNGFKTDSFIDACDRIGINQAFVEPLRIHSDINIGSSHGRLTRLIFSHVSAIDRETRARLRAQTYLFVELYDAFYRGVWRNYSQTSTLLRRVSEL